MASFILVPILLVLSVILIFCAFAFDWRSLWKRRKIIATILIVILAVYLIFSGIKMYERYQIAQKQKQEQQRVYTLAELKSEAGILDSYITAFDNMANNLEAAANATSRESFIIHMKAANETAATQKDSYFQIFPDDLKNILFRFEIDFWRIPVNQDISDRIIHQLGTISSGIGDKCNRMLVSRIYGRYDRYPKDIVDTNYEYFTIDQKSSAFIRDIGSLQGVGYMQGNQTELELSHLDSALNNSRELNNAEFTNAIEKIKNRVKKNEDYGKELLEFYAQLVSFRSEECRKVINAVISA